MIKSLHLKNIALIENAEIEFERGMNVLSGETGSGKSVIIDSINFVLGAKAFSRSRYRGLGRTHRNEKTFSGL